MERNYKGKTKITKSIYDCVKLLTKGGATIKECADYLKIGESTVSRIRQSESYEDYKSAAKAAFFGYSKKKAEQEEQKKVEDEQKKQEELKKQEENELKNRLNASPFQPVQPVVQTVQVQATHYMMEELRKMNQTLTLISNKLAFIVEQLQ